MPRNYRKVTEEELNTLSLIEWLKGILKHGKCKDYCGYLDARFNSDYNTIREILDALDELDLCA